MNETGSVRRSQRETEYVVSIEGARVALPERGIIGRAPDSDFCIANDRRVSRRHARLTICAHGVVIEDLDSKCGVYVDGERIVKSRLLVGGERIRLGHTELALLRAGDDASPSSSVEEKTVVPMSRGPADSGTFRTVDSTPHVLLTCNGD